MKRQLTEDEFLKDVALHRITIEHNQGVFRHIKLARPKSCAMSFYLTTWPGHLAISGDMGTFVFSRLADMFEFFRTQPCKDEKLPINPSYWAEKCEAEDNRGQGLREFCADTLSRYCREALAEHFDDPDSLEAQECWAEIYKQVLSAESEHEAHIALRDFEHEGFEFCDSWEWNLKNYTWRFTWCCYAIAWGIQQYDIARAALAQEGGAQ